MDEAINNLLNDEIQADLIKGCILGAFIGDSAGSYLEFRDLISDEDVEMALTVPGGGVHKVNIYYLIDLYIEYLFR